MMKTLANRPLRMLLLTNGLILLAAAMLGPIYALFVDWIGGSLFQASATSASVSITAGVVSLISSNLVDKLRRKDILVWGGYSLMGVGFLCYSFVESLLELLVVQILIGLAVGLYRPAFDAMYTEHISGGEVGKKWGTWESMNYFYTAIGASLGGVIVTIAGFKAVFVFMALLCFVSALYLGLLPRRVLA